MNEQDKRAFESWWNDYTSKIDLYADEWQDKTVDDHSKEAWQTALEYAREQQEPVAWLDDYEACKCPDNPSRCFSDRVYRTLQKHTHPAQQVQPAGAKGEADDSLLLCASDLEHSAIYDNHAEMQECIRAVAQRIKALGQPTPAAAINEQMLEALKELMYARTDKAEGMAEAAIAAAEAAKGGV